MKKIITTALACAMIISSLCGCTPDKIEQPEPLPAKYSLMDEGRVTAAKDQRTTGMCAAFASVNICESALITDGLVEADDIDLSEGHTFYYLYAFQNEKDPDSAEDRIFLSGDRETYANMLFNTGADPSMILNMYANGIGPADESVVDFDTENMRKTVTDICAAADSGAMEKYTSDYLVTGINCYDPYLGGELYGCYSAEDVKRAVVSDGAMLVAMLVDTGAFHKFDGGMSYHHQKQTGDNADISVNHITTIIGWDDNFPRDSFGDIKPAQDGAWLIQDSQGTDFGDNGCYWISYEESLSGFATVDLCLRSDYGDILYHDSLNMTASIKSSKGDTVAANVFRTNKTGDLKAVGIQTAARDQSLLIEIYLNPEECTPDSGERAATLRTVIETPGYHVVDLDSFVHLDAGDTFSVVVTYMNGKDSMMGTVPVEGEFTEEQDFFFVPVEGFYSSEKGVSYVGYDGEWYDTSEPATAGLFGLDVTINNFGIKALMDK